MIDVNFKVIGEIKTKQRPRATVVGSHARVYTPNDTINYENYIKSEFQRQCGDVYLYNKPFAAVINAYFKAPQTINKYSNIDKYLYVGNKDCDNIAKTVLDSLNKILFDDDKMCVELKCSKRYATDGIERLEIYIYELPTFEIEDLRINAKLEKLNEERKAILDMDYIDSKSRKRLDKINENILKIENNSI